MSNIPVINLQSVTDSIKQGEGNILIQFGFQDGDCDLASSDTSTNILVKASNDTTWQGYSLPYIPPNLKDITKGLQGSATLNISGAFYVLDSLHQNGDSVAFEFYIKDDAGNASNHLKTHYVKIRP
jgi:hypothetical protein